MATLHSALFLHIQPVLPVKKNACSRKNGLLMPCCEENRY